MKRCRTPLPRTGLSQRFEALETTDDEQWYVARSDVEQAIAGQTAAATSDVQACINELLDENKLILQASNRLAASS